MYEWTVDKLVSKTIPRSKRMNYGKFFTFSISSFWLGNLVAWSFYLKMEQDHDYDEEEGKILI